MPAANIYYSCHPSKNDFIRSWQLTGIGTVTFSVDSEIFLKKITPNQNFISKEQNCSDVLNQSLAIIYTQCRLLWLVPDPDPTAVILVACSWWFDSRQWQTNDNKTWTDCIAENGGDVNESVAKRSIRALRVDRWWVKRLIRCWQSETRRLCFGLVVNRSFCTPSLASRGLPLVLVSASGVARWGVKERIRCDCATRTSSLSHTSAVLA